MKIDRCHCLFLFASNICQDFVLVIIIHASSQFSYASNVLLVFTYRPCNCLWMSGFYTNILWLVIFQICCCLFFCSMLLQICQIHCTPTKYYCHSTWNIKMNHPVTKYQSTARTIIVNIIASIIVGIIVILKYGKKNALHVYNTGEDILSKHVYVFLCRNVLLFLCVYYVHCSHVWIFCWALFGCQRIRWTIKEKLCIETYKLYRVEQMNRSRLWIFDIRSNEKCYQNRKY